MSHSVPSQFTARNQGPLRRPPTPSLIHLTSARATFPALRTHTTVGRRQRMGVGRLVVTPLSYMDDTRENSAKGRDLH